MDSEAITKSIQTSIRSYEARKEACDRATIEHIMDGEYEAASMKLNEAAQYAACITELEFTLEVMECLS